MLTIKIAIELLFKLETPPKNNTVCACPEKKLYLIVSNDSINEATL